MFYDTITRHEAELLTSHVKSFKFLCSTVIWYNILNNANIASKVLQKKVVDLSAAVEILTNTLEYLKKYRSDDSFSSALIDDKEIASDLDVEPTFCKENSVRSRRKKQFNYGNSDEPMQDPETKFEVEFFSCILDAVLQSLEVRILQLQQHNTHFKFLYNISSLQNMSK
jgi:hypothetical protein